VSLLGPYVLAAALVGIGLYGVLARRNAVLVLIGVELILGGALVLLVSTAAAGGEQWSSGTVLALFVITIAAAEVALALAVILAAFRIRGQIDLQEGEPEALGETRPTGAGER
jgi:NADH-quinone oxidoreductase subunit K